MKEQLKKLIESDLGRYGYSCEKQLTWMEKRELYGYRYTKALRKCRYYKENGKRINFYLYRIYLSKLSLKFGIQINYATEIGAGLYIGHAGNIIVNYKAKLGKNVNLSQGVTIGITNRGKNKGVPTIGNDVWIGANSCIVGGITIGNDVMIAPNTFVNFDVPDHSIVVAQRASVVCRNPATENYIENRTEM